MAVSFRRVVGFEGKLAASVLVRRPPRNDLSAMAGPKANVRRHHGDPEIKVTPKLQKVVLGCYCELFAACFVLFLF
jgi:hypothetical protein